MSLDDSSWVGAWQDLGVPAPPDDPLLHRLLAAYAEPHRKYHTRQHLSECLETFEEVRELAEQPGEVALALWFHDGIYALERQDNELRSAEWAKQAVLDRGVAADSAARIFDLVLATSHKAAPTTPDQALVVDLDLAILGSPADRFDEYERQVREEYAWVPGFLFRRKRRAVLESFLARPTLYATETFRHRLEASARANLRRSLARLGGG